VELTSAEALAPADPAVTRVALDHAPLINKKFVYLLPVVGEGV
jgi:hypothetical protein